VIKDATQKTETKEDTEEDFIDDDEDADLNEAEEYEKWKIRELARIKKSKEEREYYIKEQSEKERRKNLTDQEILKEDSDRLKPKTKKKWKFLQKYYHKGAFYRSFDDKDSIQNEKKWDFSKPTLEDKADKEMLPTVMRVNNFGRSGQTKYTHLVAEDTTNWDSAWYQPDALRAKYNRKMAGVGSVAASPRKKKK